MKPGIISKEIHSLSVISVHSTSSYQGRHWINQTHIQYFVNILFSLKYMLLCPILS